MRWPVLLQRAGDLVRPATGADEHQRAVLGPAEDGLEQGVLLVLPQPVGELLGPRGDGPGAGHLHPDRRAQVLLRELGDLTGHGGGEEQRLALRRQPRHHPAELGSEPHVQHPVGLVEDQDLDVVETCGAGVEVIDQPAWRGDEDGPPLAEGLALALLGDAADDHCGAHPGLAAQGVDGLRDLQRELTGGREHQRPGAGLACEALEHGEEIGRGLAGAGRGAADDVGSGQRGRDRLRLDGSGSGEPGRRHRAERGGREAQGMEIESRDWLCGHV